MSIPVTTDNFVRAETDRMFASLAAVAGGVNRWKHTRVPTPIDQQPVIRMNRDTLYSTALVDISQGAVVTIPDAGERYLSVMVVNEDHYINKVFHEAGRFELTQDEFDTPYVLLAARTLTDDSDPADLAAVAELQDGLGIEAASARPFVPGDYDTSSLDATRAAILEQARGGIVAGKAFGRREDVDPERHLVATATGWGGLPETEATYLGGATGLPVGEYRLVARDVPVDAFWSISVYNADGYFEPNDRDAYNVNSVSGTKDADGSITVHFGGCGDGRVNCLPIVEGWNYTVRLYRPRAEVLDESYTFPEPQRIG